MSAQAPVALLPGARERPWARTCTEKMGGNAAVFFLLQMPEL